MLRENDGRGSGNHLEGAINQLLFGCSELGEHGSILIGDSNVTPVVISSTAYRRVLVGLVWQADGRLKIC